MAYSGWNGLAIGAEKVTIEFRPSWLLTQTIIILIVVGLVTGIVPAVHAARIHLASDLRHA